MTDYVLEGEICNVSLPTQAVIKELYDKAEQ